MIGASADISAAPELRWINKKLIDIDKRYQRSISWHGEKHVTNILRDFEWKYFQVITVTPVKSRYSAIDGQHRLLAALRHPAVTDVPCVVIASLDVREQAKVFDIMNTKRLGITPLARFHAAVASGDPKAMRIDYICGEAGITILRSQPQNKGVPPCSIIGINAIGKFLLRHSDQFLIACLGAMVDAWPHRDNGFRAQNMAAVIMAAAELGETFSKKKMTDVLRRWNEQEEFLRAYGRRSEVGGTIERLLAQEMKKRYEGSV